VQPWHQGEDGSAGVVGVCGQEDGVGVVRPGDRCVDSVQHPSAVRVLVCDHGEFGRVVAGAAVCGDGEDLFSATCPGEHVRL